MGTISVLTASADAALHHSFRAALAQREGIRLQGEVWEAVHILNALHALAPTTVLLLDGHLQGGDDGGAALLAHLHVFSPATKTILFCPTCGHDELILAVMHGVKGLLLKTGEPDQWVKAIQVVDGGDVWMNRSQLVEALNLLLHQVSSGNELPESTSDALTKREWEIVRWVGRGMTNKEIARKLTISDTTVKTHLHHIFSKLNVKRRLLLPSSPALPHASMP
jgi:two-component system, NarL family, nitrate/nitrite response regulator NarL